MLGLLLLAAAVHTHFEAGNIGKVEWLSEQHLRCGVRGETDQDGRNHQPSWFYFRLDGVAGRDLTIDITDLAGEYNYRPNDGSGLRNMRPVYSYDDREWTHFEASEFERTTGTIRVRLKAARNRVWIARQPPYTNQRLRELLNHFHGHPALNEEVVGKTLAGRPIPLLTITNPKTPETGKPVIWLMARQHAWESGTSWVAEGAVRWLLSQHPRAARLRDGFVFKVFPMADPDGVARGGVRFNAKGYDLNRNWDAVDAKLMPETFYQRKAILDWVDSGRTVDLFLALHNTEAQDYLEGPLTAGGPRLRGLAERLHKLLGGTTFHAARGPLDSPVSTSPGMKGRMTVYQGLFADRKLPAFLMELMVDTNPKLGRPATVADRLEFGAALVRAMCAAVRPE
ncbi:MAG TPA: M14-type cytosolic carboxypeptidase [Bryobacteraceae bacterium]|nr:M14-type cytosolic carboxypeptidase [Bryobacteraceae bacterium]